MKWPLEKLQSICDVFTDGDWIESKNQSTEGVRLVQTGNVGIGQFKDRKDKARFISEATFKELKCCEIHKGDCLVSRLPDPVGRSCILPFTGEKMITSVDCTILRFNENQMIPEFFNYFSQSDSYLIEVESLTSGATRKRISRKNLGLVEIPTPPLPEQKRIVSILDTVFADLEQTRAKTEQNLKNARELFDSYLQQVFSQKGEGWIETTLGAEIDLLTGFAFKSKEYVTHSDSTPLIRGDNIVQGKLRWDDVKRWSNDTVSDYEKYQLEVDDIVIAMDRTWVKAGMKFSKIASEDLPALLVQRVARLRVLDSLNSDYLYHLVGSKLFESYVLSIQTGLGVPHISGKQIQSFSFNKPNIEQQKILVSTMNNLRNEVTKLKAIYQKKLNAIDELKKSILQKAFSGELTQTVE